MPRKSLDQLTKENQAQKLVQKEPVGQPLAVAYSDRQLKYCVIVEYFRIPVILFLLNVDTYKHIQCIYIYPEGPMLMFTYAFH